MFLVDVADGLNRLFGCWLGLPLSTHRFKKKIHLRLLWRTNGDWQPRLWGKIY